MEGVGGMALLLPLKRNGQVAVSEKPWRVDTKGKPPWRGWQGFLTEKSCPAN